MHRALGRLHHRESCRLERRHWRRLSRLTLQNSPRCSPISPKLLPMHLDVDWVRDLCLSFPHATEQVTWGVDLTFRISGKIFAVTVLEPAKVWLSFKCSPENFAELTELAAIIPAPYMARAQWVALETKDALPKEELQLCFCQAPQENARSHAGGASPPHQAKAPLAQAPQKALNSPLTGRATSSPQPATIRSAV